jgi:hypothetical protein
MMVIACGGAGLEFETILIFVELVLNEDLLLHFVIFNCWLF